MSQWKMDGIVAIINESMKMRMTIDNGSFFDSLSLNFVSVPKSQQREIIIII